METANLTERQAFWLSHYRQCREEKLPFEQYCKKHSLSAAAFGHARKKLAEIGAIKPLKVRKQTKSKPGFVAVKAQPQVDSTMAQILLPGQVRIQIPLPVIEQLLPVLILGGLNDKA